MIKYWVIPPDQNGEFVAAMEDVLEVSDAVRQEQIQRLTEIKAARGSATRKGRFSFVINMIVP